MSKAPICGSPKKYTYNEKLENMKKRTPTKKRKNDKKRKEGK